MMTTGLLRKFSVTYLFLPNLLFSIGWFQPLIAAPVAVGLCYLLFLEWTKSETARRLSLKNLGVVGVISLLCTFFCGVDGLTSQSMDWLAHQSKFYDLYKNSWPTFFHEVDQYACYYFGFFLVPAFLSKVAGQLLPAALPGWTFTGYFLGISWLYLLLEKRLLAVLIFFFLRGFGLLIFACLKLLQLVSIRPPLITPSVRSIFEQGNFAPNQLIPTLIVSCLLLDHFLQKKRPEDLFFSITLVFIWAIFPAISLIATYCIYTAIFHHKNHYINSLGNLKWLKTHLIPLLVLAPTLVYFLSSENISSEILFWNLPNQKALQLGYFSGFVLDITLLACACYILKSYDHENKRWLLYGLLTGLVFLSFFTIGKFNDLFFRGSLPFCITLFVLLIRDTAAVFKSETRPLAIYITTGIFLMLAVAEVSMNRSLLRDNVLANYFFGKRKSYHYAPYDRFPNTYQTLVSGYQDTLVAKQYLAKKGSVYEKYMAPTSLKPDSE